MHVRGSKGGARALLHSRTTGWDFWYTQMTGFVVVNTGSGSRAEDVLLSLLRMQLPSSTSRSTGFCVAHRHAPVVMVALGMVHSPICLLATAVVSWLPVSSFILPRTCVHSLDAMSKVQLEALLQLAVGVTMVVVAVWMPCPRYSWRLCCSLQSE